MTKKRYTKKSSLKKRKHTKKCSTCKMKIKGGGCDCACSNSKPLFNGGSTDFQPNGLPINIASYNNGGYYSGIDVARGGISTRFNGGRRRTKKNLGKKRGGGIFSIFGTGFTDPLGGGGNDILSATGTSAGAALNAKIYSGASIDDPQNLFYSGVIKPLV